MRLDVEKEKNFIDLWNPEKNKWERYVKVNDEVVIREEDKKIEKLDIAWQNAFDEQVQQDCVKIILNKINEIIDKVNELEEK